MTPEPTTATRLRDITQKLSIIALATSSVLIARADVYSCMCDLNPESPTFSIRADRGEYLLELSEYDDFSFARVFNVSVTSAGTCDTNLDGKDFKASTYYWRYRQCGYSTAKTFYPEEEEQTTVTFGSKESVYTPVADPNEYPDVVMPDESIYVIEPVWVRSHTEGNYWIDGSPKTWINNDPMAEETSEWPVHGTIIRNNIIYTPIGGGKFNSSWITDGKGLGLNRMRLSDGKTMPPLRIIAPEEMPFRTADDGEYAAAMYHIDEDADGTVYFTTTTDLVYNNIKKPVAIRIYALDLSTADATSDNAAAITARFVERLEFPAGTADHSRNHYVKIQGSLNGKHTAWVATSNTGGDAESTTPLTTIYRWTFGSPATDPVVEKSTISNLYIGGYNPKSDYITVISDRLLPIGDTDMFHYHATYYDNGLDPIVYYETSPTLCRFVNGGQSEIISDMRESDGCHTSGVTPQAVGLSFIDVDGNQLMAYGSKNATGASTITIASAAKASSQSFKNVKPLIILNHDGFSTRYRQSVDIKAIPGHLLAHVGNGGIALFAFHNQTTTGIDTPATGQPAISLTGGSILFSSQVSDVHIYDISGRIIMTSKVPVANISTTNLTNGLYILTAAELNAPYRIAICH